MDPKPPPRCHGKQRSKERGNYLIPQFSHCRSCRGKKNPIHNQSRLLVAIHAAKHSRLCERMHYLSIYQIKDNSTKTPAIPHYHWTWCPAIWNNRYGFHHEITKKQRTWHDTHYHQSGMFKGCTVPTMQKTDWCGRSSSPLCLKGFSTLQHTPKGDFWQRYALYG